MIFPPILELSMLGVYEAAVPNRERIILRPTDTVNLAQYCILVGYRTPEGQTIPVWDNMFWFGDLNVSPPGWIILLTGEGETKVDQRTANGQPAHIFYWGRKQTIFNRPDFIPVLIQIGSVLIGGQVPNDTPQKKIANNPS